MRVVLGRGSSGGGGVAGSGVGRSSEVVVETEVTRGGVGVDGGEAHPIPVDALVHRCLHCKVGKESGLKVLVSEY